MGDANAMKDKESEKCICSAFAATAEVRVGRSESKELAMKR